MAKSALNVLFGQNPGNGGLGPNPLKVWKCWNFLILSEASHQEASSEPSMTFMAVIFPEVWGYDVVVSMFDFHRSDRGSNPGRGGKIS